MKVSDWLKDHVGSHEIYFADGIAKEFRNKTGQQPCWLTHTAQATRRAIEARGLGGHYRGNDDAAYGYEIAEALARKYVPGFAPTKIARGSRFYECLDALVKAGA